jgi:type I restriction enzyme S subunit
VSLVHRAPLATLVIENGKRLKPATQSTVWNLNLDQIESHTGRILSRQMVPTGELGSSTYPFEEGTVLYSKLRPYLNKVVLADASGVATTELVPVRCNPAKLLPQYLAYYLRSAEFLSFANTVVAGAKMPRMVMSEFWAYEIPVPTVGEQNRVAAILDKLNALRAKRRAALAYVDAFVQSIFIEMFGDPATNPLKWDVCSLESVSTKITDGEHLTPRRTDSGIKLLSARNVRNGFLDFSDVDYIDEAEYERIAKRCKPERGDILISCSGSIGRVAPVETDEPLGMVRSAALVKPNHERISAKFLEVYLRTSHLNRLMLKSANSSSQANLFQGPIRALPVILPPLQKQQLFEKKMTVLKGIHSNHVRAQDELNALFESIQHRAFRGAL